MRDDRAEDEISPEGLRDLLALLASSRGRRVSHALVDDETVWIKRYDAESRPLGKRMHSWATPLMWKPFLRSSKLLNPDAQVDRELRKMAAFRHAGFITAGLVYRNGPILVLRNGPPTLLSLVESAGSAAERRPLLRGGGETLARAHRAGLCHGRPHPRDIFHDGKNWGFMDFEEEPEAVMPLADAQARDAFLYQFGVVSLSCDAETTQSALCAYRAEAPADTRAALDRFIAFFHPLQRVANAMAKVHRGRDLDRFLKAMTVFSASAAAPASSKPLEAGTLSDLRPADEGRPERPPTCRTQDERHR